MGCIVHLHTKSVKDKDHKTCTTKPTKIPDKENVRLRDVPEEQMVGGRLSSDTILYSQLFQKHAVSTNLIHT